jgi:hypothetical protein
MKGEDEDWIPAPQWSLEREPCADLEAEARRLAKIVTTAQQRSEDAARRLRSRLEGYVPVDEWLERSDEARNGRLNGATYPRKWAERADEARLLADPDRHGPRWHNGCFRDE